MSNILEGLNDQQRQAVTTTEGFVRVIAGAGSGKTRALSHRFAYLVNEIGVLPGNILCVTFTNKASAEMRSRIKILSNGNDTGYIATFHSFCVTILQEDSNAVQYPKSFIVLDNADIDAMLQIIYDERGLTLRQMTFSNARDMIEIRKLFKNPDYYNDMIGMSLEALRQKYLEAKTPSDIIFYGYLYLEKKCFALDYNDLIKFVLFIFETDEEIKLKWQKRLEYIMIDEFQDIDLIQYRLMEQLCDYHHNLFVVGDPDQTIYTWRGADIRFLMDFDKKFPDVQTIVMDKNYRSTPEILACANSLIGKNIVRIPKNLSAFLPSLSVPLYHHAKTTSDEAHWIVDHIRSLTGKISDTKKTENVVATDNTVVASNTVVADNADNAVAAENAVVDQKSNYAKLGDITILYRAHYISRTIEEVLAAEKIPFTLYSGIPFFEREEIKDALSYLRMIAYKDDLSFRRIVNKPRRNIGKSRIALLEQYAAENSCSLYNALCTLCDSEPFASTGAKDFVFLVTHFTDEAKKHPASELLGMMLDAAGYEKALRTEGSQTRLDNLAELKQSAYEFEISCGEDCDLVYYLNHTALMTGLDAGGNKNAVKLMTVHTAKGLEFPHVILCGMDEGMFPSKKVQTRAQMEEERRLAFVAITRAQKTLAITDAEGRNLDGSIRFPSRFIFDIDKKLLNYTIELDESFTKNALENIGINEKALDVIAMAESFKEGDRIKHAILGEGTIESLDSNRKAYTIKFDNLSTPRSISYQVKLVSI